MVLRNTNEIKKSVARYLHRSLIFPIEMFVECRFYSAFEFRSFRSFRFNCFIPFFTFVFRFRFCKQNLVDSLIRWLRSIWICENVIKYDLNMLYTYYIVHTSRISSHIHNETQFFFFSYVELCVMWFSILVTCICSNIWTRKEQKGQNTR